MKRRILSIFIALLSAFLLSAVVFAHPGQTDEDGGHYDRSTGEYHYHHGYPAHLHTGGQCPHEFDDRTGWNSGPSSSNSDTKFFDWSDPSNSWGIIILFCVLPFPIIFGIFILSDKRKSRKCARSVAEEESRKAQALRDAIPVFKTKVNALREDYNELQTSLLTKQFLSPRVVAKVPEDSFVDSSWRPHQFGASTLADDKYYFAFNKSTSVIHRPTCTYATGLPLMNIMDITQSDDYCHPRQYSRPCQHCKPVLPGTFWVRAYHDLVDALAFFCVSVEDMDYTGKPYNKLNRKEMIVYRYRAHDIALYGVESEVISHIGYSRVGKTLFVRMRSSGRFYIYTGISPQVYDQFIHADSIGRFYNQYIKFQSPTPHRAGLLPTSALYYTKRSMSI